MVAGACREGSSGRWPPWASASLWARALPALEAKLGQASPDAAQDWADGVRFLCAKRPASALGPLPALAAQRATEALLERGSDFSTAAKWLRVWQALLVEMAAHAPARPHLELLCQGLVPELQAALDHPYQQAGAPRHRPLEKGAPR